MKTMKQFFCLLRTSQWSKSAFVLLGVIYSQALSSLIPALVAAFSFCLVSSAIYIYNDLLDREEDRLHPHKYKRPLANNTISIRFAICVLFILLITGLFLASTLSILLVKILVTYLVINLFYNYWLKNIIVLDVLCIASGFMLRVLAGTIGIGLPISRWLTLTATLMSLFIALGKRRLEKQLKLKIETRPVLKKYSIELLDILIITTGIATFISYLFYTLLVHHGSTYFLLTLPFAALGLWRFVCFTKRSLHVDDPITLFIHDNLSRLNLLCFLILTFLALS